MTLLPAVIAAVRGWIALALLCAAGAAHATQTHAEPYVTLRGAQLVERIDDPSAAVEEVEPNHTLWALPAGDGDWLAVLHRARDVDSRRALLRDCDDGPLRWRRPLLELPGDREAPPRLAMVGLDGGRVTSRDLVRSCSHVLGYVRRDQVAPAAELPVARLPFELSAIGPRVPGVWQALGIEDPRVMVSAPDRHPFDAIAYFENSLDGVRGAVRSCTAFFVGPATLVTARHCLRFPEGRKRVLIQRSPQRLESIDVDVVATGEPVDDERLDARDWMLLQARRKPTLPTGTLRFATRLPGAEPVVDALLVGYPRDLGFVHGRGRLRPMAATTCRLTARSLGPHGDGSDGAIEVQARTRTCMSWQGNSGGPLLVWNAQARRFEALAVTSAGFNLQSVEHSSLKATVEATVAPLAHALLATAREVAGRVGLRRPVPDTAMDVLRDESFPGVAPVAMTILGPELDGPFAAHDPMEFFISNDGLLRAVHHFGATDALPIRRRPRLR